MDDLAVHYRSLDAVHYRSLGWFIIGHWMQFIIGHSGGSLSVTLLVLKVRSLKNIYSESDFPETP